MMMRAIALVVVLLANAAPSNAQDAKVGERAATARVKGAQNAQVTVYEIADFQCPFCARFAREVFPRIDTAYVQSGKVRWVFVNMPLPTHANAWAASEAAMCTGGTSGQFWPMHDKLFVQQAEWSVAAQPSSLFAKYAKELGVPAEAYEACVREDRVAALLVRDLFNASSAGVTGTPAFVVNNDPIFAGYRPFEEWRERLDTAIKKAAAATK